MTLRHFAYSVFYNDQSSPFWLLKISLYKSDVVFGAVFEKKTLLMSMRLFTCTNNGYIKATKSGMFFRAENDWMPFMRDMFGTYLTH